VQEQLQKFKDHVQGLMTNYYGETTNLPDPVIEIEVKQKWAVIWKKDGSGTGKSAYAFICLQDGETKALGKVKMGDIHMPATYKAPAKTARGTILDESTWGCAGRHGIAYLR
jgi:hypothetical protein